MTPGESDACSGGLLHSFIQRLVGVGEEQPADAPAHAVKPDENHWLAKRVAFLDVVNSRRRIDAE